MKEKPKCIQAYLGIDVSKGYADFCLLNQHKQHLDEPFQLDDTHQGHEVLETLLKKFIKQFDIKKVFYGVESTGGF